jgi:hypothetical protein
MQRFQIEIPAETGISNPVGEADGAALALHEFFLFFLNGQGSGG